MGRCTGWTGGWAASRRFLHRCHTPARSFVPCVHGRSDACTIQRLRHLSVSNHNRDISRTYNACRALRYNYPHVSMPAGTAPTSHGSGTRESAPLCRSSFACLFVGMRACRHYGSSKRSYHAYMHECSAHRHTLHDAVNMFFEPILTVVEIGSWILPNGLLMTGPLYI